MSEEKTYHMSPAEFRRFGHAAIDWVADYYERVESLPVLSPVKPGDIRAALPAHPPQQGEPFEAVLRDVGERILPGITHWQSPNFFAYFPANASGPSILGDLISSGLGVQGMLWATSPACTELETHVLDWMAEMLDLPPRFRSTGTGGGVIEDSASSAALCALLAARERATGLASNARGCRERLTAYTSTQAHSSIEKGVKIAGIGRENLRLIDVDANFALRPDLLAQRINEDRAGRLHPLLRGGHGGHHVLECHRPPAGDRPDLPRAGPVAARGRGHGRHRRAVPGVPPPPGRARVCGQLLLQPAQVDVHQLRLRLFLRGRPRRAHPGPEHPARVPAQPGHRDRRGDRLPRLADPPGAALPGAEAVVRDPALRGGRPAAPRAAPRGARPGVRRLGPGGPGFRAGGGPAR